MDTLGILLVIALISLVPVASLYPFWRRACAQRPESMLPLLLPLVGAALWLALALALAAMDIKGASLSSLMLELPGVLLASSIIAIARLRLFEPGSMRRIRADMLALGAVVIVVVLVRVLVPELGE